MHRVVIDIGGTKTSAALFDGTGLRDARVAPTPAQEGPDVVVPAALSLVDDLLPTAAAVHVAVAGAVRNGQVSTLNPETFPGWHAYPLREVVTTRTGLPTVTANDAQAAAWGEYLRGAGRGCRNFVFVTVSTGIGGGVVLAGSPLVGASGLAGHLGLTLPTLDGVAILETFVSGTAVARRASPADGPSRSAPEVLAAADDGDAAADAIVAEAARVLARALANVRMLFDPDRIAIGGGLGLAPGFLERVVTALQVLPEPYQVPLVPAESAHHAGLVGAALWPETT